MKSNIGKIFQVILWPILLGIGQFFIVAIEAVYYVSRQYEILKQTNTSISWNEALEQINLEDMSTYLNEHIWIVILWNLFIILPIIVYFYRKNKIKKKQIEIKQYGYAIIIAYSISVVFNLIFLTQSNPTEWNLYFLLLIISQGIIGPIIEEYVFRGLIGEKLSTFLTEKNAFWASVLIFTFFHHNLNQMLLAFVIGIYTTYFYRKTSSLTLPILFHVTVNATALLLSPLFHTLTLSIIIFLFIIHSIILIISSIRIH